MNTTDTIKSSSERDRVAIMTARKARGMGMYAWRAPDLQREDVCARVNIRVSIGPKYCTEISITNGREIEDRLRFAKQFLATIWVERSDRRRP